MWHVSYVPYANSELDSYVSVPSRRNEILMARSMSEQRLASLHEKLKHSERRHLSLPRSYLKL